MEEIWKDIKGYEGLYQVSNLGRVKCLPKEWITGKGTTRSHKGKIKRLGIRNGYYQTSLSKNGIKKCFQVHQLVAIAFLNHTPCGHELVVDHIDDNKQNNRVDNLQIVTQRFNSHKTQGKYSSKYKGVHWNKKISKWVSKITINGKTKHIGVFKCELAAHLAYRKELKNLVY